MIAEDMTVEIATKVEQLGLDNDIVATLRSAYPDIHFTYCLDDDIYHGKPVLERSSFNIYLIDGREHCLCLTNDHEIATGLVIAEIIDDE